MQNDAQDPNTGPVSGEFVDGAEHVIGTDPRRVPEEIDPDTGLPRETEDHQPVDEPTSSPKMHQPGKTKQQ